MIQLMLDNVTWIKSQIYFLKRFHIPFNWNDYQIVLNLTALYHGADLLKTAKQTNKGPSPLLAGCSKRGGTQVHRKGLPASQLRQRGEKSGRECNVNGHFLMEM